MLSFKTGRCRLDRRDGSARFSLALIRLLDGVAVYRLHRMLEHMVEGAHEELRNVYNELAGVLEPFRRHCATRGVCCNFTRTGHMLYLTDLEASEMACAGAPAQSQSQAGVCPYLRGNLCGAREHRALGCRIYFCDRTYEEDRNALYERYLRRIREIEARHGIPHSYRAVTSVDFKDFQ